MSNPEKKKSMAFNRHLLLVLVLSVFSFGVLIGTGTGMLGTMYEDGREQFSVEPGGEFRLIRPLPGRGPSGGARTARELRPFRYKIDALIARTVKAGEASAASVYFRELRGGHRFGIREQEIFSPENLMKLPLMIAYFKWAESNPLVLRRRILYTVSGGTAEQQRRKTFKALEAGKSYTVDDLIFRMIAYSDTDAHTVLSANLSPGYLDRIFKDIYVNYNPAKKDDAVPFSAYGSFYRVLFNASYLSKEMSDKALRYLSKSTFRGGIAAGIPPDIESARKFGERTMHVAADSGEKEIKQVHEFGIVYHPNRPYLIGVMVRGNDSEKLVKLIRDISALVYEEVDRQSR